MHACMHVHTYIESLNNISGMLRSECVTRQQGRVLCAHFAFRSMRLYVAVNKSFTAQEAGF